MGKILEVRIVYERRSGVYKPQEDVQGRVVLKVTEDIKVERE